jgi:hypothetical protein
MYQGQSADGSHIFFTTSEGLWSWEVATEKASRLTEDSELSQLVFSQNGQYVAALTNKVLSVKDVDGVPDIYEFTVGQAPKLITLGTVADEYALRTAYGQAANKVNLPPQISGAVSNDGGRVVYLDSPPGALAVVDEYGDGRIGQISPVGASEPAWLLGTAGGELHDVFFLANEPLVAQDQNAEWTAIYDAREGGGFPRPTTPESQNRTPNPTDLLSSPYPVNLTAPGVQPATLPGDTSVPAGASKPLTRAQRLAQALRACKQKPRRRRVVCQIAARKRFGSAHRATTKNGVR